MKKIDQVIIRIQNAINFFGALNGDNASIEIRSDSVNRRGSMFLSFDDMISDGHYVIDSLTCLRNIMESGDCNTCLKNNVCEFVPKPGEHVRYNCFAYLGEERSDLCEMEDSNDDQKVL